MSPNISDGPTPVSSLATDEVVPMTLFDVVGRAENLAHLSSSSLRLARPLNSSAHLSFNVVKSHLQSTDSNSVLHKVGAAYLQAAEALCCLAEGMFDTLKGVGEKGKVWWPFGKDRLDKLRNHKAPPPTFADAWVQPADGSSHLQVAASVICSAVNFLYRRRKRCLLMAIFFLKVCGVRDRELKSCFPGAICHLMKNLHTEKPVCLDSARLCLEVSSHLASCLDALCTTLSSVQQHLLDLGCGELPECSAILNRFTRPSGFHRPYADLLSEEEEEEEEKTKGEVGRGEAEEEDDKGEAVDVGEGNGSLSQKKRKLSPNSPGCNGGPIFNQKK